MYAAFVTLWKANTARNIFILRNNSDVSWPNCTLFILENGFGLVGDEIPRIFGITLNPDTRHDR